MARRHPPGGSGPVWSSMPPTAVGQKTRIGCPGVWFRAATRGGQEAHNSVMWCDWVGCRGGGVDVVGCVCVGCGWRVVWAWVGVVGDTARGSTTRTHTAPARRGALAGWLRLSFRAVQAA